MPPKSASRPTALDIERVSLSSNQTSKLAESELNRALIGFTGYVGTTLQRQTLFSHRYNSANASELKGASFNLVVCCAAPAQKWIANREPDADLSNILTLIKNLRTVKADCFVLISTVDVFQSPLGVDEHSEVVENGLHPYGLHRRQLEKMVQAQFEKHLIVRLPGLIGPGLRKNAAFDLLNNNNLHMIDHRGQFQFYPMVNLWYDIQSALNRGLSLIHLCSEPVSVGLLAAEGMGVKFENVLEAPPARYDMRTVHAQPKDNGLTNDYQYQAKEVIQAVRAYAQSEPLVASLSSKGAT
jgi:hypothetical protein